MRNRVEGKSSLNFMNLDFNTLSSAHHLWSRGGCTSTKRVAASFRAKLLSGSYILQGNRARFNQNKVDPTCPLCKSSPEDLPRFVLACRSLSTPRKKLLRKILSLAIDLGMHIPKDPVLQCKYILNAANPEECCACSGRRIRQNHKCSCHVLNERINKLCLDLHNRRTQAISKKGKDTLN